MPAGYSFLTSKFCDDDRHRLPLDVTEEDFKYLVSSAKRFARSRGKKLSIKRNADKVGIIASAYSQLHDMLDDGQTIELFHDDENGGLYFVINRWLMEDRTCYYVPFGFTYDMKDKDLALLTRRFLSTFRKVNRWDSIYDSFLFESMAEEAQYEESLDDDLDEEYMSYFGDGEIAKRIKEFNTLAPITPEELLRFSPSSDDSPLYELLVKGLKFIDAENRYNMFGYLWSECYFRDYIDDDNEREEQPFIQPIEEIFSLVYSADDSMTERLISYVSSECECGDTEQDMLVEQVSLKPDKDVEFTSRVPEIIEFIGDFTDIARRYEKLD